MASLQCTVSVLRSMLARGRFYTEGRLHVIPLMNLSLPGIDPNDIKKSLVCTHSPSLSVCLPFFFSYAPAQVALSDNAV